MLPYIRILYRDVPVYGLCMAVGAVLGWLLCRARARRLPVPLAPQAVDRCFLWIGGCALAGAKVYSLALVWPSLMADLPLLRTDPALFLQRYLYGGLVFYGGLTGGFCAVGWLLWRRAATFSQLESAFLPALPLVHALGRVGCFCAGCCYGVPTDSPLGVCYPPGGLAPSGVRLVPIQLWEAGGDLLLFALLLAPVFSRAGQRLGAYLTGYGCLRFATECFRGDAARGLAGPLSGAQWISLAAVAAGLLCFLCAQRRSCPAAP